LSRLIGSSRPVRWVSLALASLLVLPLPLGVFVGLYLHFSPFLALQALVSRAPLSLLMIPSGIVLLLIVWRERWFCLNVCPTGALCDAVSACRGQPRSWDWFPQVNKFLLIVALATAVCGAPIFAILDPMALFHGAWVHSGLTVAAGLGVLGLMVVLVISLCFPRLWCTRLCPLGGLQVLVADTRHALRRGPAIDPLKDRLRQEPEACCPSRNPEECAARSPVLGRRSLFAVIVGVTGGLVLRRAAGRETTAVLRPPGALPGDRYVTTCCRCGNCARACPTKIIRPTLDLQDPIGLLAPEVRFSPGYCMPSCEACGRACPTGAIAPFKAEEKKQLFIGTAEIRLDGCLVVLGRECDQCVVVCGYKAVEISGGLFEPKPEVNTSQCVGCGACAVVCPANVIRIRPPGQVASTSNPPSENDDGNASSG
jgi:ferredoxin